jgi:hypothetical protein
MTTRTETPHTLSHTAGMTTLDLLRQIVRLERMIVHHVECRKSLERIVTEQQEEIEALRLALRYDVVRRNWKKVS